MACGSCRTASDARSSHSLACAGLCASSAAFTKLASVPVTRVYDFAGVDGGGQKWSQEIAVPFYAKQLSASMALSSSPGTEIQNPAGDPHCSAGSPYYQQLNLQEKNGYGVLLTRFLAGGSDLTSQIGTYFGTSHLAPLGALQAGICWKLASTPTTLDYEIAGVDTAGNNISAHPPGSLPGSRPERGRAFGLQKQIGRAVGW